MATQTIDQNLLSVLNEEILHDFLSNKLEDTQTQEFSGKFSPPSVALSNALSTPQLNFSEAFESKDYLENQKNAENGFSPEENMFTQKFKLS